MEVPSALTRWPRYPDLRADNLRDARLYADRADMIAALPVPKGGKVAEIGVWRAAFSKVLVSQLQPSQFFAFDIFTGHTVTEWNGLTGTQLFEGLTHRQYYEREMAPFLGVTTVVEGPSQETLPKHADRSFDLVYIDGAHDYDSVKADAALAVQMAKDNAFLVFNDYLLQDLNNAVYGIVPVVNDLVVNHGWYVVGFAINHGLYADIAIQRLRSELSGKSSAYSQPSKAHAPAASSSLAKPFRALTRMFGGS
jgi:hypothetical protein